jgi:hypothetical protein
MAPGTHAAAARAAARSCTEGEPHEGTATRPALSAGAPAIGPSDLQCYAARYPDVAEAFGNDTRALLRHWTKKGKKEGRDPYCAIGPSDLLCYAARYPDLADAFGKDTEALLRHWNEHGRLEGRDPFCTAGAMRRRSLRDQAVLGANSVYVCSTAKGAREAVRHASTWQLHATGLEWMRLSPGTHLLLYGTVCRSATRTPWYSRSAQSAIHASGLMSTAEPYAGRCWRPASGCATSWHPYLDRDAQSLQLLFSRPIRATRRNLRGRWRTEALVL